MITYLLGAGASANALPSIKKSKNSPGLPDEPKVFINTNRTALLNFNKDWDTSSFNNLNKFAEKCIEFGAPDLYAKYLMEIGDPCYNL